MSDLRTPTQLLRTARLKTNLKEQVSLGVIRLDYDYPTAIGDIDDPRSYDYDVFFRVVPGFTFSLCQSGKVTADVEEQLITAVKYFEEKGVNGITGDCGFMMWFQALVRKHTPLPVFMSALVQLPAVVSAYSKDEQIIIMTANSVTLNPMLDLIRKECGVDLLDKRFHIVGAQYVPGFEAVALGEKVDTVKVEPGIVALAKQALKDYPMSRAFLMDCTEMPCYSDAIRYATGLPVFDAITCCDFFINALRDNERFGMNNWQKSWDGEQDDYKYSQNLTEEEKAKLVNKAD